MSWRIKDEWIDHAQARHYVVFHNSDTKQEHHLINYFGLKSCPTCGAPSAQVQVDFEKIKASTLFSLQTAHRQALQYHEKFRGVRSGNGPK